MGSEWRVVTLGEIAKFRAGSAFKKEYQGERTGELPFLKVSDLNLPGNEYFIRFANNWVSRDLARDIKATRHPKGATVFAKIGVALTTNRRRLLIQESLIDNNLMSATPDEALVRPRYLYFLLCTVDFNVVAKGSALPYLNAGDLKSLRVVLPGLSTQDEVLEVLEAIEDRIDNIFLVNEALEAIAQALFKSWFVDFDPVRAKAEGREPEGMDAGTAALFPSEFVDSALGSIPKGWRVGILEDLLILQRGFDLPAKERSGDEYPVIAASGPTGTHSKAMVKGPGVVTGRSGVLGKVFIELGDFWPLNTTLWVREFKAARPCFAYELLARLDLRRFNVGSAVPTLNRNHIHGMPQLVPTAGCVNAFEEIAAPIRRCIRNNLVQSRSLADLRDTLLPRLISGRLCVPEGEGMVADELFT